MLGPGLRMKKKMRVHPHGGREGVEIFFNLVGDSYNMILFLKDWSQSSLKKQEESLLQYYKQD